MMVTYLPNRLANLILYICIPHSPPSHVNCIPPCFIIISLINHQYNHLNFIHLTVKFITHYL